MARNHYDVPTVPESVPKTVRLGAGNGSSDKLSGADIGKFVKLAGDSRYDFCAAGDAIEAQIVAFDPAPQNGYSIGSVRMGGKTFCTADGSQAAGTGAIAVGDYVVCGTVTAKGTALPAYARVRKATDQAAAAASPFARRVVSLFTDGTGAVGTTIVIERA